MIPKIAFMFLAINSIHHEAAWVDFFKNHEDTYSLYVHAKEEMSPDSFFASSVIPQRVDTKWENVLNAQTALFEAALKDPANTKFVFLSDSTIPVMNFKKVYQYLLAHPHSEFEYFKNPNPERSFGNTPNLYKNPGWIILNRKHAQLMVDDTTLKYIFAQFPYDCEHYPSTFLAHHNLLDEVINNYPTFELWPDIRSANPHFFNNLQQDVHLAELIRAIKSNKFLFARKFAPTCDLKFLATALRNKEKRH